MKYMILIYGSQRDYDALAGKPGPTATWSAEDLEKMGAFMEAWNNDLVESGEFVDAQGLTAPVHARRVSLRDGVPVVTDGPYAETQEQDRSRWDAGRIAEGVALITEALTRGAPGPYQLQAAIAALHDEAPNAEATDWPQITALYELLLRIFDNPVVRLNHAVAVAMATNARAGLDLLERLEADDRIGRASCRERVSTIV